MEFIKRHEKGRRFSRATVHNGTAYFSGLTASNLVGDIVAQTREVLEKADTLLAAVGSDRTKLLHAMIWLRDIDDFAGMNLVWEEWIDADHPPARATVESRLAAPDILVEIQFTVAVGHEVIAQD